MIAYNPKTKKAYQVIKYNLRVIERGSDTDFGKATMMVYEPIGRSKIGVNPRDFVIYDNWDQVKDLVQEENDSEELCGCPECLGENDEC